MRDIFHKDDQLTSLKKETKYLQELKKYFSPQNSPSKKDLPKVDQMKNIFKK